MELPLLNDKRYMIRDFDVSDTDDLYDIFSDPDVMEFVEPPFSLEQTEGFIHTYGIASHAVYALYDRMNNRVIGSIIFHPFDDTAWEIGWILQKDVWGKGLAVSVTNTLMEYGIREGITTFVIECDTANKKVIHIAAKAGFTYCQSRDHLEIYRYTVGEESL